MKIIEKPIMYNESIAIYLTQLRDSGKINMLAAAPFIMSEFNMTRRDSIECLKYWIHTFEKE